MSRKTIPLNERIIFALDVDSKEQAEEWLDRLGDRIRFFKVGLQLFLAAGFPVIEMITDRGHKVMVDLKFFDVPETVKLAVRQLTNHGVSYATVHGNDPILRAAIQARGEIKILAVTVLTSFDESDMRALGLTGSVEDLVYIRAKKALSLGCDGVVCSGLEAQKLSADLGNDLLIVTPGIRPGKNDERPEDDQKRVLSAREAIIHGADQIVVGRPIRDAKHPLDVVESMQTEIQHGIEQLSNLADQTV